MYFLQLYVSVFLCAVFQHLSLPLYVYKDLTMLRTKHTLSEKHGSPQGPLMGKNNPEPALVSTPPTPQMAQR